MIPIAKPLLEQAEADAASHAVKSGWVSQGKQVAAFEREFAKLVGAPFACAVSNCTTALHLALIALGIGRDDEVITVSHSFIASANAVRQCGAVPVFVDVEPNGYNIDPTEVKKALSPRTKAILVVHQMGMPCDMEAILPIAQAAGVPVIEDAACAAGSEIKFNGRWQKIGVPIGDVACFSFHPRKVITTGEGGMLTTRRPDLDEKFRLLRQHGMSVSDTVRHASTSVIFESYPVQGFNYRMTDIQAAIGREQLKRLPGIVARRRDLAEAYSQRIARIKGLTAPKEPDWARSNWQSYPVRLGPKIDQKQLMQALLDAGVASRRGIMNIHQEGAHADLPPRDLTRSETARDKTILLPLFAQMSSDELDTVIAALEEARMSTRGAAPVRRGALSAPA